MKPTEKPNCPVCEKPMCLLNTGYYTRVYKCKECKTQTSIEYWYRCLVRLLSD